MCKKTDQISSTELLEIAGTHSAFRNRVCQEQHLLWNKLRKSDVCTSGFHFQPNQTVNDKNEWCFSFFFFLRAISSNMWSNHSCKWCNRQELLQINELINVLLDEAILSNISNYNNITETKWGLHGLFCLKWTSDLPLSPSSSSQAVIECKLELFLSTHHKHTQSVSGKNWHAAHDSCGETQAFIQHCAVCWTGDNEQQRCFILK